MRYTVLIGAIAACAMTTPVWAACPVGTDYSEEIVDIVQSMRDAPNEMAARQYSAAMWDIWLDAPDELAQAMLDEGLALLQMGAHPSSKRVLSRLIDYCPQYPEGYNQRAFAAFLSGDLDGALVDLDEAIRLQPVHLGALTGKVLTLIRLGRDAEAQVVLREALAINPWLAERALLDAPAGEDI